MTALPDSTACIFARRQAIKRSTCSDNGAPRLTAAFSQVMVSRAIERVRRRCPELRIDINILKT